LPLGREAQQAVTAPDVQHALAAQIGRARFFFVNSTIGTTAAQPAVVTPGVSSIV
jgi:hypothetical protein